MIRFWGIFGIAVALTVAVALTSAGFAQDTAAADTSDEDRGYLQALIEDNLSSEGTQVRIQGFVGSLASQSSFDKLTIADTDGIWLTIENAVLDWRRSALLSGTLDITELSAKRILLARLPAAATTKAEAEPTPFKLPDLPVEINLGVISAASISLGPDLLGIAADLSLEGSANLSGGNGELKLALARIDGHRGEVALATSYSNADDTLKLDLLLDEGTGGIAARLLSIYQQPSLRLSVKGAGPLTDFRADIDLSTNSVQRLNGQVTVTSQSETTEQSTRRFAARLAGDVAPLWAPQFAPFFGPDVALDLSGQRLADSRIRLQSLNIKTAALSVTGQADFAANGMPERFDLAAELADQGGGQVVLPVAGPETVVGAATLTARYDAAQGDTWTMAARINDFARDGLTLRRALLEGSGTIQPGGTEQSKRAVTAGFRLFADGADHSDAALARALGTSFRAATELSWQEAAPLDIASLSFDGAGLHLSGHATIDGSDTAFLATGQMAASVDDLSRLSGLIDRDIAGAADLTLTGEAALRGGSFDIAIKAQTADLRTGVAQVDPLLAGQATVDLAAVRDADGLRLPHLHVSSEHAAITASGTLSSTAAALEFTGEIKDLALIDAALSGPAAAQGALSWAEDAPIVLKHLQASGAGATMTAEGQIDASDADLPVSGKISAQIADLAYFRGLTGMKLSGSVSADAEGSAVIRRGDFDLTLDATSQDAAIGISEVDRLLSGQGKISAKLTRQDAVLTIDRLDAETPAARLSAQSNGKDTPIRFEAHLSDVGLIAPDFPGPASATGTALPQGDNWDVALQGTGPGGTSARVTGTVANTLKTADLTMTGAAPLGLANPFIAPRSLRGVLSYDLRLAGAPSPDNISGSLSTSDARLSAPLLHTVLTDIAADVALANGQAQLSLSGAVEAGGRVTVNGPLSLSAPFNAGLEVAMAEVTISDPALYTTKVNGDLNIGGPLTAGGKVAGTLTLSETEVQVPSGQVGGYGYIPDIIHVNEPAASRATRARAGLLASQTEDVAAKGAIGLDLRILAPGRIFVRGRGLDAEFGGQLRLLGDTAAIIPQGQFDLIRGRLDILGKRFDLTEGLISIQGAFDPFISLIAETVGDTVTSRIVIEGLASDLKVRFESDPELPEDEVVAQLLFGRDLTKLSAFQLAQLASAVATLTGKGGEGLVGKLRSGIGLDDLDVTSTEEGSTEVTAGKYLSENLYSDITVDSEGKTEVNLNLDLNSRFKVKGRVTNEGDTGVGVFYQRDY